MAFNAFLKIDGIEGESTDAGHKGWIDVISYSLGSAVIDGKAQPSPLSITKLVDKATPKLMAAACGGPSPGGAIFSATRISGGGSAAPFMKITFRDVQIASVGIAGGDGDTASENVTLTFSSAEWQLAGTTGAAAVCTVPPPAPPTPAPTCPPDRDHDHDHDHH